MTSRRINHINLGHPYWQQKTDYLFGVLFGIAACYHFSGLFIRINDASEHRHVLFLLIDLYCVYGFLNRHRIFYLVFSALTMYQLFTYGIYLFTFWEIAQQIHWISLGVLIIMPIGLLKLVIEYFTDW